MQMLLNTRLSDTILKYQNMKTAVGLKTTGHRRTQQDTARHHRTHHRTPQNTTGLTTGHQKLPKLPN